MVKKIVAVVYDPPSPELPYLSVIFIPGHEESPTVTPFPTVDEAEAFNYEMAMSIVARMRKERGRS
jgi:hypothetical protein